MFSSPGHRRVQRPLAPNMFLLIWDEKNNGFVEPMESPWIKMLIKPKEFQWFWRDEGKVNFKLSIQPKELQWFWRDDGKVNFKLSIWKWAKSGSGVRGPESAPRGSKSTTFANGFYQLFNLPKSLPNLIGEPSVLPIEYPIYWWHQAQAWEVFGINGWYVLSCTSKQISKFTVQA